MDDILHSTRQADSGAGQATEQIQVFQNWIDRIEIRNTSSDQTKARGESFINGPYADIKELIGKISSRDVEFNRLDCQ